MNGNVTDAQGRVLDLTRQFLDEVTDGQRETRDTFRRVIEANRGAGQAAIEATRDVVGRAGSVVPSMRGNTNGAKASAGSARKSREASEA